MPLVDRLHFDNILFPEIAAGRARYMAYSKAQLMERTNLGDDTDRRDFFYHLLKAKDPETGEGFSIAELWGESNLLYAHPSSPCILPLLTDFSFL